MTSQADASDVRLANLTKRYGDVTAVEAVDLDVAHGEFFTMLGPSGSGKTTTLRMIAGFERPDAGRVELGGEDVSRLPPFERNLPIVNAIALVVIVVSLVPVALAQRLTSDPGVGRR